MPLIRFVTARDLFDAFPTAARDVDAEPSDAPSLQYLRALADGEDLNKAVAFCAYLLPRREAVNWGCHCIRALDPKIPAAEQDGLRAAEGWVQVPEEERRLAALELGMRANPHWPSTWLALAAGWSGGNVLLGVQGTAPAPPQQTARAVRAAILTAVARLAPAERTEGQRTCLDAGIRLAAEEGR
jgi:hypothetical protein